MNQNGILPRQKLLESITSGAIRAPPLADGQLQPSSLDMRLGDSVTCISTSFLPQERESLEKAIQRFRLYDFELSEGKKKVLIAGQTYIIPLQESANLPQTKQGTANFFGTINPKSTTGRSDSMTRVVTSGHAKFDSVPQGKREMYVEVTPLSFNTLITKGLSLNQLRIGYGTTRMDEASLKLFYQKRPLLYDENKDPIPIEKVRFADGGIEMSVDLEAPIVAYRAKKNSQLELDLTGKRGSQAGRKWEFWEPIERPKNGELALEPDSFYLLATREGISLPPEICGTLEAYDVASGEGRKHYAGYLDDGFGHGLGELLGTSITLEVRMFHAPFRIVHGQPICLAKFENMLSIPTDDAGEIAVYGVGIYKSNYQGQPRGPNLAKQFLDAR